VLEVALQQPPDASGDEGSPASEVVRRTTGGQAGGGVDRPVGQPAHALVGEHREGAVEDLGPPHSTPLLL
jgi:hypothetical protein